MVFRSGNKTVLEGEGFKLKYKAVKKRKESGELLRQSEKGLGLGFRSGNKTVLEGEGFKLKYKAVKKRKESGELLRQSEKGLGWCSEIATRQC